MSNFLKGLQGGYGSGWNQQAIERAIKIKEIKERLTPLAKRQRNDGERFKIIAKPLQRRAVLDTTFNISVKIKMEVTVRAIDDSGREIEIDRIWTTKNGRNKDIRRPSKGKGEAGDLGPYIVPYKPSSTGISKFKVQTVGKSPSIIYYGVRQVG